MKRTPTVARAERAEGPIRLLQDPGPTSLARPQVTATPMRRRLGASPVASGVLVARVVPVLMVVLVAAGCAAMPAHPGSPSASRSAATYLGLHAEQTRSGHVIADHSAVGFMAAQTSPRRLWVGGTDRLSWIDPDDETVHLVDTRPGVGLFVDGGSLYRAAYVGGDVARYDVSGPEPREVARVPAPSPLYVNAGPGGVWVTDHDGGSLVHLDPSTLAQRSSLQLGPRTGDGHALSGLTRDGGHLLWVVSERDRRLYAIGASSGRVVGHVQLDARPTDQVVRDGTHLWVMLAKSEDKNQPDLELVDTATRKVVTRVVVHDDAHGHSSTDLVGCPPVVVGGQVWAPSEGYLVHLDAARGWKPDRVIKLPVAGLIARHATVAFGSVWVEGVIATGPRTGERIVRIPVNDLN